MSETYGGITRSKDPSDPYYTQGGGGQITLKMLQDAFVTIERHDEENRIQRQEFWDRIRPYQNLLNENKFNVYLAVYRLLASAYYPDACLSSREHEAYMKILAEEGIKL